MLRRLARTVFAEGLSRTGAADAIGRANGVHHAPLVLGYHRVVPDTAPANAPGVPSMSIRVSTLKRQIEEIARRFRFVTLDEMGRRIEAGTASGLAALTFDDGYVDFKEYAFPLLLQLGVPAALFVVTDLVERGGGFLHDRLFETLAHAFSVWGPARTGAFLRSRGFVNGAVPEDAFGATRFLLGSLDHGSLVQLCDAVSREVGEAPAAARSLTWDELRQMSRAGLIVGSHTRTHALLTRETEARLFEETLVSRRAIETELGLPVPHFAYPDGAFNQAAVKAVARAGYKYAYTGCDHTDARHPLLTLRRRVLWEGSTVGFSGGFSRAVFALQLNGVFDPMNRCSADHAVHAAVDEDLPRVAIVAPSLDLLGGQSIQADAIRDGLVTDGFRVRLVPVNPRFPRGLRWVRRIPVARTLLNEALYLWSLRHLRSVDVAHVFSASYWSFLLAPAPAMLVARLLGKRVILNYHSGEAADHLNQWGVLVHPWLSLAHDLVVPSEYLRRVFASHGYSARVIQNVVDTARFEFRARSPLTPRLLSTRNLEPGYRVDVVLDAFTRLKKVRPDASLVIAGSGSEEARLRRRAEGVGGVTFLGRVAPEEMPRVCASNDIFVNASEIDNQPLSLLEAFASGLPVVTTPAGGIAHMARDRDNALVVPTRDPDAIAAAILALLRDQSLATSITERAHLSAEEHSWSGVRRLWAEAYTGRDHPSSVSEAHPHPILRAETLARVTAKPAEPALGKERSC